MLSFGRAISSCLGGYNNLEILNLRKFQKMDEKNVLKKYNKNKKIKIIFLIKKKVNIAAIDKK